MQIVHILSLSLRRETYRETQIRTQNQPAEGSGGCPLGHRGDRLIRFSQISRGRANHNHENENTSVSKAGRKAAGKGKRQPTHPVAWKKHLTHLEADLPIVIAQANAGHLEEVEVVPALVVAESRGAAFGGHAHVLRGPRPVVGDEGHEPFRRHDYRLIKRIVRRRAAATAAVAAAATPATVVGTVFTVFGTRRQKEGGWISSGGEAPPLGMLCVCIALVGMVQDAVASRGPSPANKAQSQKRLTRIHVTCGVQRLLAYGEPLGRSKVAWRHVRILEVKNGVQTTDDAITGVATAWARSTRNTSIIVHAQGFSATIRNTGTTKKKRQALNCPVSPHTLPSTPSSDALCNRNSDNLTLSAHSLSWTRSPDGGTRDVRQIRGGAGRNHNADADEVFGDTVRVA